MRLNVATVFALPSDFTPQDIAGLTHKPGSYAPFVLFQDGSAIRLLRLSVAPEPLY